MLIDFKFHTCNKYIHAQEVTLTKDNPILDTDLLSFKGKKLLTDLTANNFYISIPSEDKETLTEIVNDLTNTVATPKPIEYNTYPLKSALKDDNTFINGSGFSSKYSTNVQDGIIQLSLAPAEAFVGVIGPSTEGLFEQVTSEISVLFAVTSVGDRQIDVFKDYAITLKCGEADALSLIDNVWVGVNKDDYILTDSAVTKRTIQNVTRESFLTELVPENTTEIETWTLTATHLERETVMSITIKIPKA